MTEPPGSNARPEVLPARTPWAGAMVALALGLAPAVAYGGPLGFAILPPAAALLVLWGWRRRRLPHPVLLILAALWIWAAASYAWSPAAPAAVRDYGDLETLTALKLAFVLMTGGVFAAAAAQLSGPAARRALWALGAMSALYAVLVTVDALAGAPVYNAVSAAAGDPSRPDIARVHLGQGTVLLPLVAWPLAVSFDRARWGRPAAGLVLVAGVVAPLLLGQGSAALALLAGGMVFGFCARLGPGAVRAFGALAAAAVLAAPWLVLALDRLGALAALKGLLPASTDARLDIWRLVAERTAQHPLRGWGLDASRLLPPPVSLHPHNGPLQIWFELGAHGAVLAALVWWALFDLLARAARTDRVAAAASAGAAAAYFVISALSFGVWQEWWLGLGAVTAAVSAALLVQRRWERMARPADGRLREAGLRPL